VKSGGDICGYNGNTFDLDLCENWIKSAGMLPMLKLMVDSDSLEDV
jgi:hypothetical protein